MSEILWADAIFLGKTQGQLEAIKQKILEFYNRNLIIANNKEKGGLEQQKAIGLCLGLNVALICIEKYERGELI